MCDNGPIERGMARGVEFGLSKNLCNVTAQAFAVTAHLPCFASFYTRLQLATDPLYYNVGFPEYWTKHLAPSLMFHR